LKQGKLNCVRIACAKKRSVCKTDPILQGILKTTRENGFLNPDTILVLASGSPRRSELVGLTSLPFQIYPGKLDETQYPGEQPAAYVLRLAEEKARAVAAQVDPGSFILAADTIVVDGLDVLGKPAGTVEAAQVLRRLRGRSHTVLTAIALYRASDGRLLVDLCETLVPMREYSEAEIEAYVASGDPLDKAGSYAIQNRQFHPVERLSGCYANVVGLPLCHLARSLRKLGIEPRTDVPATCQTYLAYDCPVFREILTGHS
jgi:septum formation protein